MTPDKLRRDNELFRNTAGVSQNNIDRGFRSAFWDSATGAVYLSRFANGSPAPIHMLDGLPDEVVLSRDAAGRIVTVKQTLVAGFVLAERFYTREQVRQLFAV